MMRILAVVGLLAASFLLIATGLSCSEGENITAVTGSKFTLPVGQTAVISGESLSLKFVSVETDSRCPRGVECIQAGEVKCRVRVNYRGAISNIVMEQSGNNTLSTGKLGNYSVIYEVQPYPVKNQPIADADYKLVMTVNK